MTSNRGWRRREQRWTRYVEHYTEHQVLVRRLAGWNPRLRKDGHADLLKIGMKRLFRRLDQARASAGDDRG